MANPKCSHKTKPPIGPARSRLTTLTELDQTLAAAGLLAAPRPKPPSGTIAQIAAWAADRLSDAHRGISSGAAVDGAAVDVERLAAAVEDRLRVDVTIGSVGDDNDPGFSFVSPKFALVLLNADHPRHRVGRALCSSIGHIFVRGPGVVVDDDLIDTERFYGADSMFDRTARRFADELQRQLGFAGPAAGCDDDAAAVATITQTMDQPAGSLWHRPGRRPPGLLTARCVQGTLVGAVDAETLAGLLRCDAAPLVKALHTARA